MSTLYDELKKRYDDAERDYAYYSERTNTLKQKCLELYTALNALENSSDLSQ